MKHVVRLLALVGALLVGYLALVRPWSRVEPPPDPVATSDDSGVAVATPAAPRQFAEHDAMPDTIDEPGCLSVRAFEEHPLVQEDVNRMHTVTAGGPDIDAYRGIDAVSLGSYAEQGDSAAMAVVGARSVLRAFGMSPSRAIEWLNGELLIPELLQDGDPLAADAALKLNDAAYWFYQAALHGRVFALQQYGTVRGRLFGGAVGLGWISAEDFRKLDAPARSLLLPGNVYQRAAFDLVPQLQGGALGIIASLVPESARQGEIRAVIVADFDRALKDAELPSIDVPETASPGLDTQRSRLCASVLREFDRRQPSSINRSVRQ